jgi:hypothetical protein
MDGNHDSGSLSGWNLSYRAIFGLIGQLCKSESSAALGDDLAVDRLGGREQPASIQQRRIQDRQFTITKR